VNGLRNIGSEMPASVGRNPSAAHMPRPAAQLRFPSRLQVKLACFKLAGNDRFVRGCQP